MTGSLPSGVVNRCLLYPWGIGHLDMLRTKPGVHVHGGNRGSCDWCGGHRCADRGPDMAFDSETGGEDRAHPRPHLSRPPRRDSSCVTPTSLGACGGD